MLHFSRETPAESEARLRAVIAAARLEVLPGAYVFEEWLPGGAPPKLDGDTIAAIRDDQVWSMLRPAGPDLDRERFGVIRFHFPPGEDNSGFVGWLATGLKQALGTGVFVICGHNSNAGGIYDYTGFPIALQDGVLRYIRDLRESLPGRA